MNQKLIQVATDKALMSGGAGFTGVELLDAVPPHPTIEVLKYITLIVSALPALIKLFRKQKPTENEAK